MSSHFIRSAAFLAAALLFAPAVSTVFAADPRDFAVLLTAQVQSSPARITLQWPASAFATGYTVSRKLANEASWNPLATLGGGATGFADVSVVLGAAYEYEVAATSSDGILAYGYIYAGMEVPFLAFRGRVILVVDNTVAPSLTAELDLLQQDLVGDGWAVVRHDVPRQANPAVVQALIRGEYQADPANTEAVLLLGHVPVPYSGDISPDMHENHRGAWPADVFYGAIDATWSDDSVSDTTAEDPRNYNVPGDGKFDQSTIPGPVRLQVGRVDLSDLPSFAPRTEVDLLRQYLNKNHGYRHRLFSVGRRGLLRDNFGDIDGDAPATDAWRTFVPFFDSSGIDAIGAGSFFPALAAGSYLWAYGGGGGEYYQADGVGSTSDFAAQSPQGVFYMLDGSYFPDWDSTDNFLRAALASAGYGLAAAATGLPHWFLHHMALGGTIGFSTQITQNNQGLYKNQVNLAAGQVHIALMGDPTLRMHVVAPPVGLTAQATANSSVLLQWGASPDSVLGYYLYRANSSAGPFARLNRSFLTGSAFTDSAAPLGQKVYMLRAVKLETLPSGTYYNPSQGIFASVDAGVGQALPAVTVEAVNPTLNEADTPEDDFVISRAGSLDNPLTVSFSIGGSAMNGVDYETVSTVATIPANASSVWVPVKPIPDHLAEGDETVTLTLGATSEYMVGSTASATILLTDIPSNQPPQISVVPDQILNEDSSSQGLSFTVSDPETSAVNLDVSASSSNPVLVPAGGLSLSGTGANRALIVTPAPGQTGTSTITLTVSDGSLSASTSFHLSVQAVLPAQARIDLITRQANATTIDFEGTSGGAYNVQASKDLLHWMTVGSGVFGTKTPMSFLDTSGQTNVCRFYRIQSE